MHTRRSLEDDRKNLRDLSEEVTISSSSDCETDSTTSSSSEEEADVAFLLLDPPKDEDKEVCEVGANEEEALGPYEVIEELLQPKVE